MRRFRCSGWPYPESLTKSMAVYAVGDVQGCASELQALLQQLRFDPAHDRLWLVGDLVNRGPQSLQTLRMVRELGDAARCVLGNHDLHLLALALTASAPVHNHTLHAVLDAPDCADLIDWLRQQPLAHYDAGLNTLMVHAGVLPPWNVHDTLELAAEVSAVLAGPQPGALLEAMYERDRACWSASLKGIERWRFVVNCLTRIRYCRTDGSLDFEAKSRPGAHRTDMVPWFRTPQRAARDTRLVFGHWSTLGLLQEPGLLALDTGCVWGGTLTAMRLDAPADPVQIPSQQPAYSG